MSPDKTYPMVSLPSLPYPIEFDQLVEEQKGLMVYSDYSYEDSLFDNYQQT